MMNYKVRWLQPIDEENWLRMWREYMKFYQKSLPQEVVNNIEHASFRESKYRMPHSL